MALVVFSPPGFNQLLFGLLPAAVATEIGSQTQQPLARVVVGGMVTTLLAVLFVMPLMARRKGSELSAH